MAIREILLYPHPVLKQQCAPADGLTPEVQELCQDLIDTLAASPGVGVAAPQIGVPLRVIAVDVTPKNPGHGLLVLVNPELVLGEGRVTGREGCLSIPEYTGNVERYEKVVIRGLTHTGEEKVFESTGLEAICLQHELDHLDGILFLDRVTCLKTHLFRRKGAKPRLAPEEIVK